MPVPAIVATVLSWCDRAARMTVTGPCKSFVKRATSDRSRV